MTASRVRPVPVAELDLPFLAVDVADAGDDVRARRLELAGEHWLARTALGYAVLRYEDVTALLRDRRLHSAAGQIMELSGVSHPGLSDRQRSILAAEGDEHTRLRRLVGKAFAPRAADRLRPFMREVLGGLVDRVAPNGRADFAVDICDPYPIPVICELLGAPKSDWQLFSRWANDILKIFDMNLAEDLPTIVAATEELDEYTARLIADRRNVPADDLLTELIAAEEAGDRLNEAELVAMVEAVILGGTDTTRSQLGCAMAVFADHPDQWRLLAEQPALAPRAVEEVMRYYGAVRGTARIASEDVVYRDVIFPKGTFLALAFSSANYDAEVFSDRPSEFDITKEPSGSPHLTFGGGIHYCLGAALARAELQEALPLLARRLPDPRVAGDIEWKSGLAGIFGPRRFPIEFAPGR